MTDIIYIKDGMFTKFFPETPEGEAVWREMANKMNGVAVVLNFEAQRIIYEIRKAGYKVSKARPVKMDMSDDALLAELLK